MHHILSVSVLQTTVQCKWKMWMVNMCVRRTERKRGREREDKGKGREREKEREKKSLP